MKGKAIMLCSPRTQQTIYLTYTEEMEVETKKINIISLQVDWKERLWCVNLKDLESFMEQVDTKQSLWRCRPTRHDSMIMSPYSISQVIPT